MRVPALSAGAARVPLPLRRAMATSTPAARRRMTMIPRHVHERTLTMLACHPARAVSTTITSSTTTTSPTPPPPPSTLLGDDSMMNTPRAHTIRLYALLAACATSNQFGLLAALVTFVPLGLETHAAEAIIPVQVFAGIPRTIEGLQVVRSHFDERQRRVLASSTGCGSLDPTAALAAQWLRAQRDEHRAVLEHVLGASRKHLLDEWVAMDDGALALRIARDANASADGTQPSQPVQPVQPVQLPLLLTPQAPSLPPLDASYPPVCPTCGDTNSTSIRQHRGTVTLQAIYGSATHKLLSAMLHLHPSLEAAVHQHIYGLCLCSPYLDVHIVESIAICCLMYVRTPRQLYSHIRGSLLNGHSREFCIALLVDAAHIYAYEWRQQRESQQRESQQQQPRGELRRQDVEDPVALLPFVQQAIEMVGECERTMKLRHPGGVGGAASATATAAAAKRTTTTTSTSSAASSANAVVATATSPPSTKLSSQPVAGSIAASRATATAASHDDVHEHVLHELHPSAANDASRRPPIAPTAAPTKSKL